MKTNRLGSVLAFIVSGVLIASSVWLFMNRQWAMDQLSVWSYEPTAAVQAMSSAVALTDEGEFVFYATQPKVVSQEEFNKECPRHEPGSPILGCYTGADRIYVYDITNEELAGIKEVTAVHEMLHAVWYRMDSAERERVTSELQAAYESLDNDTIRSRMEYYQRTEPGELMNELHSILGTEVAGLSDELEAYYAQYFDRPAVLELHDQYNGVYTALYDRSDELYALMETLSTDITERSDAYSTAAEQYSRDVDSFNARAEAGDFSSINAFYSERAALVARSEVLDTQRQAINTRINTYNAYQKEYEAIADKIDVLNESLDSFNEIDAAPSV